MDLLEYDDDEESESETRDNSRLSTTEKSVKIRTAASVDPITIECKTKKQKKGHVTLIQPNESSSLNDYFQRTQPHIQGNWAGHVFVNIPTTAFEHEQQRAAELWKDRLEEEGWTGPMLLHTHQHVSLSRPFYLQRGSIDSFVQALQERLKYTEKGWFRLHHHDDATTELTNDECTRTFLVWPVRDNHGFLDALVRDVDAVLERYDARPYYHPAKFHISVASIPQSSSVTTDTDIQAMKNTERKPDEDNGVVIPVVDIHCTFGTTEEFSIPLGSAIF